MIDESFDNDGQNRDYIYHKFHKINDSLTKLQNIQVTDKGLKLTEHEDEALVLKKLAEFVDWLYLEHKKLN